MSREKLTKIVVSVPESVAVKLSQMVLSNQRIFSSRSRLIRSVLEEYSERGIPGAALKSLIATSCVTTGAAVGKVGYDISSTVGKSETNHGRNNASCDCEETYGNAILCAIMKTGNPEASACGCTCHAGS